MVNNQIAVLAPDKYFFSSFNEKARAELVELGWSGKTFGDVPTLEKAKEQIVGAQVAITSWDSIQFNSDMLAVAPDLKLICHAAGSVKPIVCPEVWQRSIRVTSAAAAIAIGVGEHSLGLLLSAMKNCYAINAALKTNQLVDKEKARIVEMYGIKVGVIGCGLTGRHFIKLLGNFDIDEIAVYDPFVGADDIGKMGCRKVDLDELMSICHVVVIHAPRLPETRHIINKNNLRLLKDNAIIVNTGSGWLIDEDALIAELKNRPIIAALDVTFPEPPAVDSELRKLPNVILTGHIAGVAANNRWRIGNLVVREIKNLFSGKQQLYPVTEELLARIA